MFHEFYRMMDDLHEAIKRIRNVWIPFTPSFQGATPTKGEYMIDDKNICHVRMWTEYEKKG